MPTMYCALCRRPVEARRHIGAGSVLLAFASFGLSVLAIPFYAKRCPICKSTAVSGTIPDSMAGTGGAPQIGKVTELEHRLNRTLAELEAAHAELDRLRTEQDFYRQLLGDPSVTRRDPKQ